MAVQVKAYLVTHDDGRLVVIARDFAEAVASFKHWWSESDDFENVAERDAPEPCSVTDLEADEVLIGKLSTESLT